MQRLFPSILPGVEFVDDTYHREELERKDWPELQQIAKEHPNEEVNGRSSQDEIIEALTGEERL